VTLLKGIIRQDTESDWEIPVNHLDLATLLTVYIRIKLRLDLQADKSSVVVKGPFSPLKCEPKVSNLWNKCVTQNPIY
jgi:hypothetical protein